MYRPVNPVAPNTVTFNPDTDDLPPATTMNEPADTKQTRPPWHSLPFHSSSAGFNMTKKTFQTKAAQLQNEASLTAKKSPTLPSASSASEVSPICLVCAEAEPKYWAMAACGHKICYVCSLRLRALYGSKNCPICKVISFEYPLIY